MQVGQCLITYTATDSTHNTAVLTRTPVTSTGARVMITTVLVGSAYSDAGATAFDAVDGNLTSQLSTFGAAAICERGAQAQSSKDGVLTARIEACSTGTSRYLFAQVGLRGCTFSTGQPGNFTIVFSVADSLGQTARVARQVVVMPVCPAGEHLCADKASCSQGGVCVSDLGSSAKAPAVVPANTPPNLVLRTTPLLGTLISVKQGMPYAACAAGQIPVLDKLCKLGVNATDVRDGDLTARVLACPAASCLGQGCPRYEFRAQGISSCAVNTSAAVGTQFNVTFMVFDLGLPSLNASITRTVVVAGPCPTGQTLCSDNSCSINCALSVAVVVERAVPIITLLPAPVTGAAQILYGAAANTSLLPCPSFHNRLDCGAVAVDADGNDVTGSMAVVDVTPCPANTTCSGCDITYANIGLCLPGSYLYIYRARDSQGRNAGTLRTVQVLDVYNVQAELSLGLPATEATATPDLQFDLAVVAEEMSAALGFNLTRPTASAGMQLLSATRTSPPVNTTALAFSALLANLTCLQQDTLDAADDNRAVHLAKPTESVQDVSAAFQLFMNTDGAYVTDVSKLMTTIGFVVASYQTSIVDTGRRRLLSTPCSQGSILSKVTQNTAYGDLDIRAPPPPVVRAALPPAGSSTGGLDANGTAAKQHAVVLKRYIGTGGGNAGIGGLLLHQTHQAAAAQTCKQRFSGFLTSCAYGALLYDSQSGTAYSAADSLALLEGTQAASPLQPFGVDPVFLTSSSIYRSDIAGTPVVVQTELSADGATRLLHYLQDANFLDKYTATLAMRLLTYNSNSRLFGYARVDLTWLGAGQVQVASYFSALPQLDYNTGTRAGRLRLATDTALVLLALVQAAHVTSSVYGRVQAWRNVLTKRSWQLAHDTGNIWTAYDVIVLMLFIAMTVILGMYAFQYALPFQLSASYDIYGALSTAPARILLPKKVASAANIARVAKQYAKADNSTFGWASQPGELGRWSLPDDNTGLNELGAIYFLADKMTDLLTLYNFLQGMVLLLLLVRLLRVLSAQKRLSLITSVLVKVAPEIFNLMIVIVMVGVLLGAFGHLCFGHFEDRLTTPGLAVSGVFETMFSQQLQSVTQDLQSETTFAIQMNWLERALAFVWYFIVAIYTIIILWNFIIPVIRLELGRQRKAQGWRVPGIRADLLVIAIERLQRLRGAPSNDAIGELVAVVAPRTRKKAGSIWARLRSSGLVRARGGSRELAGIKVGQELFDANEMRYALTTIDSAPADLPAVAETIISRFGEIRTDWPEKFLVKRKQGAFAMTILKAVRDQKALDAQGQQDATPAGAAASTTPIDSLLQRLLSKPRITAAKPYFRDDRGTVD
ncbi:hypothetical protein WJX72_012291 [[Myrmecia] bisecta]|uniref:Polycystin cation channel PKD1/PKD2 domain-containing protein n=1 Tax=[Myrmecia] bisecta TaxID=41462 RepID=A0AAW1Q8I5_9CHLO